MIVRELGMVVGMIDDKTLQLTDSTSDKLTGLVKNWVKNGIEFMSAQEEDLEKGQVSGDKIDVITRDNKYFIDALENELTIAGFEVQTA